MIDLRINKLPALLKQTDYLTLKLVSINIILKWNLWQ